MKQVKPATKARQQSESWQRAAEVKAIVNRAPTDARDAAMSRLVELYDFAPIPYVSFDQAGRIEEINFAAARLLGKSRSTLLGKPFAVCVMKDHAPSFMRHLLHCRTRQKQAETDLSLKSAEGAPIPVHLSSTPTASFVSNGAILYQTVIFDLRERLAAEQAVRKGEQRFRRYFDLGLIGMAIYTPNRQFIEANDHLCQLLGYSREELLEKKWSDLTHPTDLAVSLANFNRVLAGEIDSYQMDRRWIRKDAKVIDTTVSVSSVRLDNGLVDFFVALVQDVTERRKAEEALRESQKRFAIALKTSGVIVGTMDRNLRFTWVHNHPTLRPEQVIGRTDTEILGKKKARELMEFKRTALRAGTAARREITLELEGGPYTYDITLEPLRDNAGKVTGLIEAALDITDRKLSGEKLREGDERFRLLVDNARDYAMFMLTADNIIHYWNAGAERVFGWSAAEAVGQSGSLIFTKEDRERGEMDKELERARRDGSSMDRRWHVRKDGSRLWIDGVMRRIDDEKTGEIRGYAKIGRDATDIRMADEELEGARDDLERRVVERTTELVAANTELQQEIALRHHLEREILAVTERERARIGQDLHDSLCQELTATAFLLNSEAKKYSKRDPNVSEALQEAATIVNANAGRARDFARGLHPFELESTGLIQTLRELASQTNEKVPCRFEGPDEVTGLDDGSAVNLYRIGQEAVTNALKHAQPSAITLKLQAENGEIVLSVSDDGTGLVKTNNKRGMGIHLMKYRANVSGGTLDIHSRRGRGTTVRCRVPITK